MLFGYNNLRGVGIITYVIIIGIAFVTWFFPLWLEFTLFVVNLFVPDPLPYVDEIIMGIGLLKKVSGCK